MKYKLKELTGVRTKNISWVVINFITFMNGRN